MNRAERRRRGVTRSRATRAGSLASAGVLMSVGLFGAYMGNPRAQRAYAAPSPCARTEVATNETELALALDDSTITCIEIQGSIGLTANLPAVQESDWENSVRETDGLTIFGSGDDTIDGNGWLGPQLTLSQTVIGPAPNDAPATLNVSDLTLTDFANDYGAAIYVYLRDQTVDAEVRLDNVIITDSTSKYSGAGVYLRSWHSDVYLTVTDSEFTNNVAQYGGAVYAGGDDTSVVTITNSVFSHNGSPLFYQSSNPYVPLSTLDGGAIFATASGRSILSVGEDSEFNDNEATRNGGAIHAGQGGTISGTIFEGNSASSGGAVFSAAGLTVSESTFTGNTSATSGGAITANGETYLHTVAIIGNSSGGKAAGLLNDAVAPMRVVNTFIGGNTAGGRGGGIYSDGSVALEFATIYDDTSAAGASEIVATDIAATMSVVGNSTTGDIWEFTGTLDDTASVSTSDDTVFSGSGSGNVAPGSLDLDPLTGTLPGQVGRTPSAASVLALQAALSPLGFAPSTNPLPSVTNDQLGMSRAAPFTIGARQLNGVAPSPSPSPTPTPTPTPTPPAPAPNPPAPQEPPSAPRGVSAVPGVESAVVSWSAPSSSGSSPVTSYEVTASPGDHGCLVSAPALTCTITGLTPGESYTFVVKASNSVGWSALSAPSSAVVPVAPPVEMAILNTSSRDRISPSVVRVDGSTTGLVGAEVTPYVRKAGQTSYVPGINVRTVDSDGRFTWQRKSGKKIYVYFLSGDVRSNRLIIGPQ